MTLLANAVQRDPNVYILRQTNKKINILLSHTYFNEETIQTI